MNWSEMQASWDEMSVVLQANWPKLANDELKRINGNRDEIVLAIQRCYGIGQQQAETELCEFEKDVRRPGAVK